MKSEPSPIYIESRMGRTPKDVGGRIHRAAAASLCTDACPMADAYDKPVAVEAVPVEAVCAGGMETTDVPVAIGAPLTQTMERVLGPLDAVSVQQTPRGCVQECLGCTAQSEYLIYPGLKEDGGENAPQIAHMIEHSNCALRVFCSLCGSAMVRPFSMPITVPDKDGEELVKFSKDWSMPVCCIVRTQDFDAAFPCCCCLPALVTTTPDGTKVGETKYVCDECPFVPKFHVFDADGRQQYLIRPDTCMGGACINCSMGGRGSRFFYVPFIIRDPETQEPLPGGEGAKGAPAQITKVPRRR